jgi:hypothetical protein
MHACESTFAHRNYNSMFHNHIFACQNHTLRVEITLVHIKTTCMSVEIALLRVDYVCDNYILGVEITLLRLKITIGHVFEKSFKHWRVVSC